MTRLAPPLVLVLALAAVGCGGGSRDETSTAPTASRGAPSPGVTCARMPTRHIARLVAQASGRPPPPLHAQTTGTSTLLACRYTAPGVKVHVNLDTASRSHRRYLNRVTELAQFSLGDRRLQPHPVSGVGDHLGGEEGANWLAASDQLLTVEGQRYLIVDFSVRGASNAELRAGAVALARLGFAKLPGN